MPPFYPTHDFGPAMKGMVIGGLGILHVFLAQFAIGGGMLLYYFQWLAERGREPDARRFLDGFFRVLVLVSFVLGAVTGVAMWLTTIQVGPRTIGLMVDEFHWLWAVEWTFFGVELVSGYLFYRYAARLPDRTRRILLAIYALAAWFSLFWINGILSWQLTPGRWLEGGGLWAGFFNPSFWPSLLFRTVVATTIAALAATVVINTMAELDRERRRRLITRAAHLMAPMIAMPLLGLWFFAVIPADSRAWLLGGSVPMTMFVAIAAGASLLVGGYAALGLLRQKLYVNGATATLLLALAFGATGAGEFVREGARKPFTVREVLYSNSIGRDEVAALRARGSVTDDPYPLAGADAALPPELALGAKVFRLQCSVCHTASGANGLAELTRTWTPTQLRMNVAMLQRTKGFMPPFAGPAAEVEALARWIESLHGAAPASDRPAASPAELAAIAAWLDEAGTEPAPFEVRP
ncbi:MAG: cytochrome ubiquinol oxidase subunit I [Myxococcales bacterium]|nr:cytochrome ubiquinol oxidase subunit I [Myxococcales bacterium]